MSELYQRKYLFNDPLGHLDLDGTFALELSLLGLSWGGASGVTTAIFSNPIGWAVGGVIVGAVAVGWATNKFVESHHISPTTGNTIHTLVGGVAGVMIHAMPVDNNLSAVSVYKEGSVDPKKVLKWIVQT